MTPIAPSEFRSMMIDILHDIHCFCEEKGLHYYLAYGLTQTLTLSQQNLLHAIVAGEKHSGKPSRWKIPSMHGG